jgi:hypothetical protein
MGCDQYFRYPSYNGCGGLPTNLEWIIRNLEQIFGDKLDRNIPEIALATFNISHLLDEIQNYWERGPGNDLSPNNEISRRYRQRRGINHNLAVYGWGIQDIHRRTSISCEKSIKDDHQLEDLFFPIIHSANPRAALRVLDSAQGLTPLQAAQALGKQGTLEDPDKGDGIETLIIFIGANNALGSILEFSVRWSKQIYENLEEYDNLRHDQKFTVWDPIHFKIELDRVVTQVKDIRARHVIFATVPHVTIAPFARGVGEAKVRPDSRYFPYYTHPWISDQDFNSKDDPNITGQEARAIDSAIDHYNYDIAKAVEAARIEGLDWYLLDIAGILDRLAARRYKEQLAQPYWWTPYELPAALQNLNPVPNARFFKSDSSGRTSGGLFSLDGIHPTTIGYAIIAQEFINIMQHYAGVEFYYGDGVTKRTQPVRVDFQHWIKQDTLISDPPKSLTEDLKIIGWIDQKLDIFKRLMR